MSENLKQVGKYNEETVKVKLVGKYMRKCSVNVKHKWKYNEEIYHRY